MTAFIITVAKRFALVSQDTFVTRLEDACIDGLDNSVTADPAIAAAKTFSGGGHSTFPPPLSFASKMQFIPHLRTVIGGAGDFAFLLAWGHSVNMWPGIRDVEGLAEGAENWLRSLEETIGLSSPTTVFYVGWSNREGRPRAFLHSSADGFAPVELKVGHSFSPAANMDDPESVALCDLWEPAAIGTDADLSTRFHVALAQNQYRAYRSGLFLPGLGIGGELQTARIDEKGLSVVTSLSFENVTETPVKSSTNG